MSALEQARDPHLPLLARFVAARRRRSLARAAVGLTLALTLGHAAVAGMALIALLHAKTIIHALGIVANIRCLDAHYLASIAHSHSEFGLQLACLAKSQRREAQSSRIDIRCNLVRDAIEFAADRRIAERDDRHARRSPRTSWR